MSRLFAAVVAACVALDGCTANVDPRAQGNEQMQTGHVDSGGGGGGGSM